MNRKFWDRIKEQEEQMIRKSTDLKDDKQESKAPVMLASYPNNVRRVYHF